MMKRLIILASLIILIAITGSFIWSFLLHENNDFTVSITAFSIGVVTFFGVIGLNRSPPGKQVLKDDNLRTAIACSLVISYLFIVCFTAFVGNPDTAGEVTREFVKSFANVIGVTIAFYFGASAVTEIFSKEKQGDMGSVAKSEEKVE